jgi:hypothetical protein
MGELCQKPFPPAHAGHSTSMLPNAFDTFIPFAEEVKQPVDHVRWFARESKQAVQSIGFLSENAGEDLYGGLY